MIKDSSEEQIKVIYCEAGHKASYNVDIPEM